MLLYLLALLVLSHLSIGRCVSVRLMVPEAVRAGTSAILVCQFDLQGQQLYSVKWYRGNFEFFRFLPKEKPPAMAFSFPGLNVDVPGSSAHQVSLLNIPAKIGGRFSCEVSAEGPRFTTASDYADLYVLDLQGMRRPEIHVSSNFYDITTLDRLSVNCTTSPTIPPPTINFYINNVKVFAEWIDIINVGLATLSPKALEPWLESLDEYEYRANDVMETSTSDLNYDRDIRPDNDQPLWVRCEAILPQVYHFISTDVPLFPQIDEPEEVISSGERGRYILPTINLVTLLFLQHFHYFFLSD